MAKKTKVSMQVTMPRFADMLPPSGFLVDDPACHALFYYACSIARQIEHAADPMKYEGEIDDPLLIKDKMNLFKTVAQLYGVAPERMSKFWKQVDLTFVMQFQNSKRVPAKFRFDSVPELRTQ